MGTQLFCTEDMLATLMLMLLTDMPGFLLPPALVLMPSLRDLMPPPKELLPMLPMLAMVLDTMVSAMLKLIQLFCTEDMLATLMLMLLTDTLPVSHSPPAPVLMPPHKELLLMLPMLAMVLVTMVSVMLMLTLLFCTEDMLATLMLMLPTDTLPVSHSPPALVLTPSLRDLMPPPKELLPMLPMLAMVLDTMVSVMLKLIQLFCTEDMLATLMLM